jgi:hypothetical protein
MSVLALVVSLVAVAASSPLSASQAHPPPGWNGGDRIALHGSPAPGPGGRAVTAGCLRADNAGMRWLMVRVPVRIRR